DTEDLYAVIDPEQHDITQGVPEAGDRLAIEMDVDDVLVLLRRVFRELDRAIWPPVEPFGMLPDPRVVGRALDREVERDFQSVIRGRADQPVEVFHRSKFRMNGVVAALLR